MHPHPDVGRESPAVRRPRSGRAYSCSGRKRSPAVRRPCSRTYLIGYAHRETSPALAGRTTVCKSCCTQAMLMHAPPPGRGERKPCCTQAALRTRVLLLWQEEKPCCTQAVLTHVPHWGIPDERQALLEVGRAMAREPGDSGDQVLLHAGRAYARTLAADARRQALSYAGRAHARTSLGHTRRETSPAGGRPCYGTRTRRFRRPSPAARRPCICTYPRSGCEETSPVVRRPCSRTYLTGGIPDERQALLYAGRAKAREPGVFRRPSPAGEHCQETEGEQQQEE